MFKDISSLTQFQTNRWKSLQVNFFVFDCNNIDLNYFPSIWLFTRTISVICGSFTTIVFLFFVFFHRLKFYENISKLSPPRKVNSCGCIPHVKFMSWYFWESLLSTRFLWLRRISSVLLPIVGKVTFSSHYCLPCYTWQMQTKCLPIHWMLVLTRQRTESSKWVSLLQMIHTTKNRHELAQFEVTFKISLTTTSYIDSWSRIFPSEGSFISWEKTNLE